MDDLGQAKVESFLERTKSCSLLNFLEFSVTSKRNHDSGLWNLEVLGRLKECQEVRTRNPQWSRLAQGRVISVDLGLEC